MKTNKISPCVNCLSRNWPNTLHRRYWQLRAIKVLKHPSNCLFLWNSGGGAIVPVFSRSWLDDEPFRTEPFRTDPFRTDPSRGAANSESGTERDHNRCGANVRLNPSAYILINSYHIIYGIISLKLTMSHTWLTEKKGTNTRCFRLPSRRCTDKNSGTTGETCFSFATSEESDVLRKKPRSNQT